jgi:hypothetical protein
MISVQLHLDALDERIDAAQRLIDETHGAAKGTAISREARGLSIVLLFAAYENLLYSLTRTLLETAVQLKVGNGRLQPGFRAFALENSAKSVRDSSENKLYSRTLPNLIQAAAPAGRTCTIDTNSFPRDGSFMKRSQIEVWCELFDIAQPRLILANIWHSIDSVVAERNGVAHGRLTPDEVGRGYSEKEIRDMIRNWHGDWTTFLRTVESRASTRDFFRTPR